MRWEAIVVRPLGFPGVHYFGGMTKAGSRRRAERAIELGC
jgi:hypothetical protein